MQHLYWAELTCSIYTHTMQNLQHAKSIPGTTYTMHHLHAAVIPCSVHTMQHSHHAAFTPCNIYMQDSYHAALVPCRIQTMQHIHHTALVPRRIHTTQHSHHAALTRRIALQQSHHAAFAFSISTRHWCRGVRRGAEGTHPSCPAPWAAGRGQHRGWVQQGARVSGERSLCCQQPPAPRPQGTEGSQ